MLEYQEEMTPREKQVALRSALREQAKQAVEAEKIAEEVRDELDEEEALDDLIGVDDEDVVGEDDGEDDEDDFSDLTDLDDEDEMDMFGVSSEDVMGTPPKPKKQRRVLPRRTLPTPLTGLRGIG